MPALMRQVILDEKAQRDRFMVADYAGCFKPVFGDVVYNGGQNLVFRLPPAEQGFPGLAGIVVSRNPGVLRVPGALISAVDRGTDKALAVVRRGI